MEIHTSVRTRCTGWPFLWHVVAYSRSWPKNRRKWLSIPKALIFVLKWFFLLFDSCLFLAMPIKGSMTYANVLDVLPMSVWLRPALHRVQAKPGFWLLEEAKQSSHEGQPLLAPEFARIVPWCRTGIWFSLEPEIVSHVTIL